MNMRNMKKLVALGLCAALLITGVSTENFSTKAKAANAAEVMEAGTEAATKDAIDTPSQAPDSEETKAPQNEETKAPENEPSQTPESKETQAPSQTPAGTTTPASVTSPSATTTPASVSTSPSVVTTNTAVTGSALGDKIIAGNYVYVVTKVPTLTAKGTVRIKRIRNAAMKKSSLTVADSITKNGLTYSITGISTRSFKSSTALKKVTIGKNVTYLGARAFQGLTKLQTVTLGSGLTEIRDYAFAGCTSLRKISIPAKVKKIGTKSFYNCKKLKAVIINTKVLTKIGKNAFTNTRSGAYVVIASGKKTAYKKLLKNANASRIAIYTY